MNKRKLLAKIKARQTELGALRYDINAIIDKLYLAQAGLLCGYNDKFRFNNKYARRYWSGIENALDGAYAALEAVENLRGLEELKQSRIDKSQERRI